MLRRKLVEVEPLIPARAKNRFQLARPGRYRLRECFITIGGPDDLDWLSSHQPITASTEANIEDGINWSTRCHGQGEGAGRNTHRRAEQRSGQFADGTGHTIALDGDDSPIADGVQESERQLRRLRAEFDAKSLRAMRSFKGVRPRIFFRRPDHHDRLLRRFRKKVRAEVVTAHVGGEEDGAATGLHLLEILPADELPIRNHAESLEADVVADRPGVVPEDPVATKEVPQGGGTGLDHRKVAHHSAPPRSP